MKKILLALSLVLFSFVGFTQTSKFEFKIKDTVYFFAHGKYKDFKTGKFTVTFDTTGKQVVIKNLETGGFTTLHIKKLEKESVIGDHNEYAFYFYSCTSDEPFIDESGSYYDIYFSILSTIADDKLYSVGFGTENLTIILPIKYEEKKSIL